LGRSEKGGMVHGTSCRRATFSRQVQIPKKDRGGDCLVELGLERSLGAVKPPQLWKGKCRVPSHGLNPSPCAARVLGEPSSSGMLRPLVEMVPLSLTGAPPRISYAVSHLCKNRRFKRHHNAKTPRHCPPDQAGNPGLKYVRIGIGAG